MSLMIELVFRYLHRTVRRSPPPLRAVAFKIYASLKDYPQHESAHPLLHLSPWSDLIVVDLQHLL